MLKSALFNWSSTITSSAIAFGLFCIPLIEFEYGSSLLLISFGSTFVATPFGFGGLATIWFSAKLLNNKLIFEGPLII